MKRINFYLTIIVIGFYLTGIAVFPFEMNSREVLHQIFYLTGIGAWFLMTECIVIASRPAWIERLTGQSLVSLMNMHKSLGWLAVFFVLLHVLAPFYASLIPVEQVAMMRGGHIMETLWQKIWIWSHPIGALLGIVLTLYIFTLVWRDYRHVTGKRPWDRWEKVHRMWAWVYVGMALHCLRLMHETEMIMPLGILNLLMTLLGLYSCWRILTHSEGKELRDRAAVEKCVTEGEYILLTIRTSVASHVKPGQYVYLRMPDDSEDAHPFSVAFSDETTITVMIKNVGVWTQKVSCSERGDVMIVEGPWGKFTPDFHSEIPQLWIAGGTGIAPFIAWLQQIQNRFESDPEKPIRLIWTFHGSESNPIVEKVALMAKMSGIQFTTYVTGDTHRHLMLRDFYQDGASVSVCGSPHLTRAMSAQHKELGGCESDFRSESY